MAGQSPAGRFDDRIAPLLARSCVECHGPSQKQGGLDLTTAAAALKGGTRGPALAPGKPDASWLWKRVAAGEMPPGKPLAPAERALLKDWIAGGGAWGTEPVDPFRYSTGSRAGYDWWSLQPLMPPAPPKVRLSGWTVNPIDAFVLARLEAAGLKPSPAAERGVLIRRVYHDMLGLPPSPEAAAAFAEDTLPGAYERLVDRVLASPHYGERWARHWLDVVRFGETQGFERNKLRPNAWKYRDWVVEAFNADLPYDEFVRLQVAGDVLRPDDPLAVIASGFLVLGPYDLTAYTDGSAMMRAAAREEELEGLVGTVSQTFLGLTVNCARCHDHKFDPVAQKEYYRFLSALGGTYHGDEKESRSEAGRSGAETERQALLKQAGELRSRDALRAGRLESRARLLAGGPVHRPAPRDPGAFHVLARGDFRLKGEVVAPGGLAAVRPVAAEWGLDPEAPDAERRTALARWLTDPRNPLTARTIANRVWGDHFGASLVPTPNDLGFNGGRPTHPDLLDWLAGELVRNGWRLKALHRAILLSATYRQSSQPDAVGAKRDAENRLLWRRTPRRREAEAVRDAVLALSGELDPKLGGPSFRDWTVKSQGNNEIYTVVDEPKPEFNRRSLYRMVVRAGTHPFLDVLDCPDPSVATPRRTVTTTPLQALSLLNSPFMERGAEKMGERLRKERPAAERDRIVRAYRLAFGRDPAPEELRAAETFIAEHGLAQFCLVLFNTNEFLYVD